MHRHSAQRINRRRRRYPWEHPGCELDSMPGLTPLVRLPTHEALKVHVPFNCLPAAEQQQLTAVQLASPDHDWVAYVHLDLSDVRALKLVVSLALASCAQAQPLTFGCAFCSACRIAEVLVDATADQETQDAVSIALHDFLLEARNGS